MVDVENIPEHTYYKSWKGNDFFERAETELGGKRDEQGHAQQAKKNPPFGCPYRKGECHE